MKIGIMQPYFLPYIGYWQLIKAVDKYIVYDDVNYIQRGWINRNRILVSGEPRYINVLIKDASQGKLINEIEVFEDSIYKTKLLKTLEYNYKKAPYYQKVFSVVEGIIKQKKSIWQSIWNIRSDKFADTYQSIPISSYRPQSKNNGLKGQDKIIAINKMLGSDEYINAIGGQNLYSPKDFEEQGLKLIFLKTGAIRYPQFNSEFVQDLSIIDVMMFNSTEEIQKILNNYLLLES